MESPLRSPKDGARLRTDSACSTRRSLAAQKQALIGAERAGAEDRPSARSTQDERFVVKQSGARAREHTP
jgi:hypothetical protein